MSARCVSAPVAMYTKCVQLVLVHKPVREWHTTGMCRTKSVKSVTDYKLNNPMKCFYFYGLKSLKEIVILAFAESRLPIVSCLDLQTL